MKSTPFLHSTTNAVAAKMVPYVSQTGYRDTYISATQGGFTKQPELLLAWGTGNYNIQKRAIHKSQSPNRHINNYHADGTGRDTYVSYENGGQCFQQPVAYQQNTFQNKLRKYSGSAFYVARNYNHPKRAERQEIEIQENSFVQKSPQVKRSKYIKDFSDEIIIRPQKLQRQYTSEIGAKRLSSRPSKLDHLVQLRSNIQSIPRPVSNLQEGTKSMANLQSYQSNRLSVPKRLEKLFEVGSSNQLLLSQSVVWDTTPLKKSQKIKSINLRASHSLAERTTLDESFTSLLHKNGQSSSKKTEEKKHFSKMLKSYNTQEAIRNNSSSASKKVNFLESSTPDVRIKKKKVQNILSMLQERTTENKSAQIPVKTKSLRLIQSKTK